MSDITKGTSSNLEHGDTVFLWSAVKQPNPTMSVMKVDQKTWFTGCSADQVFARVATQTDNWKDGTGYCVQPSLFYPSASEAYRALADRETLRGLEERIGIKSEDQSSSKE